MVTINHLIAKICIVCLPVIQVKSRYCLPFPPQSMRLTVELRTRENQEEAARCLETQGAVLSQDSTKSIAGAKVNTAKAWYEMQINYSNYEKYTLIIASICLQKFQ